MRTEKLPSFRSQPLPASCVFPDQKTCISYPSSTPHPPSATQVIPRTSCPKSECGVDFLFARGATCHHDGSPRRWLAGSASHGKAKAKDAGRRMHSLFGRVGLACPVQREFASYRQGAKAGLWHVAAGPRSLDKAKEPIHQASEHAQNKPFSIYRSHPRHFEPVPQTPAGYRQSSKIYSLRQTLSVAPLMPRAPPPLPSSSLQLSTLPRFPSLDRSSWSVSCH